MQAATCLTEHGTALRDEHRHSPTWAGHTMAVRGHPRSDIGRSVLGEDAVATCAACIATTPAIPQGARAVLRVWNGSGFALVRGTIEAVEPCAEGPDDPWTRLVILAEDDANTYRAGDIVLLAVGS